MGKGEESEEGGVLQGEGGDIGRGWGDAFGGVRRVGTLVEGGVIVRLQS